jgi:hypothetical protein
MKLAICLLFCALAGAQEPAHQHSQSPPVPLQPLAQQVRQLEEALNYLGQPFPAAVHQRITATT